jgi:hypothetical protein
MCEDEHFDAGGAGQLGGADRGGVKRFVGALALFR